jgi:hypothetical protein
MKYDVWLEGFAATGESAEAEFLGAYEANTFEDACRIAALANGWKEQPGGFEPSRTVKNQPIIESGKPVRYGDVHKGPTCWGCRMFDNEADAREGFG